MSREYEKRRRICDLPNTAAPTRQVMKSVDFNIAKYGLEPESNKDLKLRKYDYLGIMNVIR
jgi:hypothetical protein